jgi:xanthine dehydrogenase accessory factor
VREVISELERWQAQGERAAVATVVATRKSAPRPVGSKLAVSERGELAGSVSGGCVESEVAEAAREVLAGGPPRLLTFGIADEQAWEVGLPCGGEIDVWVEELDADELSRLSRLAAGDERAVLYTTLEGADAGAKKLAVDGAFRSGVLVREGARVFAEVFGPPPRIVVIGATDLAEELCAAARRLGWRTVVADPRGRFATRERVPSADELLVAWPDEALAQVAPDESTAVVVLTHEERFDIPAIVAALASDAFYVGAIGSRRTQAKRRDQLLDAGVTEEQLERLHGPAGLDIGAATPQETAISILAEIIALRAGKTGGPLRDATGAIHAEHARV